MVARAKPRQRRRWVTWLLLLVALPAAGGVAIRLLNPLPPLKGRTVSHSLSSDVDTPLRRAINSEVTVHPGRSGVHPLIDGASAFAARVHLARQATRTLDLQYYIWHSDLTGTLLYDEVRRAADRGVRVRLQLDDNSTSGLDPILAALDSHPHIEVRLFNPFTVRNPRLAGYVTDFGRLNRRMHNKAFIADNQAAVIGGRNIGDEYFEATSGLFYADLDLISVGPVVNDLSKSFDAFWASRSSYPAASILPAVQTDLIAAKAAKFRLTSAGVVYAQAAGRSNFVREMAEGRLSFEWAATKLVADDPAKGLGKAPKEDQLWPKLTKLLGRPRRELGVVSGYFVPTKHGVGAFVRMEREGVRVKILTNAFEATDVPIVHSGYAKWRKQMLRAGVELYEMRGPPQGSKEAQDVTAFGSTGSGARGAGSALHAKTFAVDGERLFVGSFNFDPRSAHLNTELGFVVESAPLARRIRGGFSGFIPANTYKVELGDDGNLVWRERIGDRIITHTVEPGTNRWQRTLVRVLSQLPIEWLL